MDFNEYYDIILTYGIATEDELNLICGMCGKSVDTLNDLLFFQTGYRDIDQFLDYELEED